MQQEDEAEEEQGEEQQGEKKEKEKEKEQTDKIRESLKEVREKQFGSMPSYVNKCAD